MNGAAQDARRTSLFLYIKPRSGRERGCQESPRGCRRWYPHPAENPFARNRGWLGAVVTLSSTGDAACGLHKQRLRRTGGGGAGGCGCNVPTPCCVRLTLLHPLHRRTPRRFAAPLVGASSCRSGIHEALRMRQARNKRRPFSTPGNRWIAPPLFPSIFLQPSPVIPLGKPFEILPGKVRAKPRRLSRLTSVCLGFPSPLTPSSPSSRSVPTRRRSAGRGPCASRVINTRGQILIIGLDEIIQRATHLRYSIM